MASSAKKTITWEEEEDEEDDEDENYADDDLENNDIGLSLLDDFFNETTEESLLPSDWEDCIADRVSATVGEGTDSVFELFCEEVQFVRMAFRREFENESPPLSKIVNLFFGPDSKIFRVIKDNINITHSEFIKFMKTFCVQSSYRVSCGNV
jgi:hypothetical protein